MVGISPFYDMFSARAVFALLVTARTLVRRTTQVICQTQKSVRKSELSKLGAPKHYVLEGAGETVASRLSPEGRKSMLWVR